MKAKSGSNPCNSITINVNRMVINNMFKQYKN